MQHGPAPDQGLIAGVEEAHRDRTDAVLLQGFEAVLTHNLRLGAYAQHQGNVGAVNITIKQPDFESHPAQSNSKIDRDRGLPYPTFA